MTDPLADGRQADGQEDAQHSDAGAPRESGPDATLEALESEESFRLSVEELNERDEQFTQPRKEQGPPLAEEEGDTGALTEESAEGVAETPVPEPPS
jgi:hypothetical protein